MKKKSAGKKKVHHSKKKQQFFSEKYPILAMAVLALFCIALALAAISNANGVPLSGNAVTQITGNSVLDNTPTTVVINVAEMLNLPANTWKDIVIAVIMFLIVFAGIFDLIELTSFFSNKWVVVLIAAGLAIIGALSGVISAIMVFLGQVLAGLGAAAVFFEIGVSLLLLIGLSWGAPWAARRAAKRYAAKQVVEGIKKGGEISEAIAGLKQVRDEFKRK